MYRHWHQHNMLNLRIWWHDNLQSVKITILLELCTLINFTTICSLQLKIELSMENSFPTHSEGDLSDTRMFELESEGLQEKVTDCTPVMMVNCHDHGSL